MTADEQVLHDYLDQQGVYQNEPTMQDMVINSFYAESDMDNDDEWEAKIKFVTRYYDLFKEYVTEDWKSQDTQDYYQDVHENGLDDLDDIPEINTEQLQVIDLQKEAATTEPYLNLPVAMAADHVVRLSVMTEPYFWHYHPNSEEIFIVLEGTLVIELEDRIVELAPQQLFTIPRNTPHRTSPKNGRSVNLTVSSGYTQTVEIAGR
jgi:mannose-6-phosphate isomerase-like protein (cupin superfamily)